MLRTNTCGELTLKHKGQFVTLCGWVQKTRDKGGIIWVDLRDRYGITQLIFEEGVTPNNILENAKKLGRESVLKIKGEVIERIAKNENIATGEIEIKVSEMEVLSPSKVPPFTIENDTDGGEELRMKYRYLDIRRKPIADKLHLRHQVMQKVRQYLSKENFVEIETPYLIKSTPEGARDFVVPSRLNENKFYALPQSPQTFKQLLMVGGLDRYFQIVRCFRDEDLRSDRQPEFTQIDCEMSFVEQEDILNIFENLVKSLYKEVKGIDLKDFERMTYHDAMKDYGSDKPDLRFGMKFVELNELMKGKEFSVFDEAELIVGIKVKDTAHYSRKQLDELRDFVMQPQIGGKGLVYIKVQEDGSIKSSIDKFYSPEELLLCAEKFEAKNGDLILLLSGKKLPTRNALNELRLEMGARLKLGNEENIATWIVDFPLLEWDEENESYHAMHHPFTAPKPEDIHLLDTNPAQANANAYDLVINGVEAGGGSIRIHNKDLQQKMFSILGFEKEDADEQFGFLMNAFEYGAPPHGGIAFGLDRLCAVMEGENSIRDFIAFPKNNTGRDIMIESPSVLNVKQLEELKISLKES